MMEEKDLYEQDIDISSEFLKMKFWLTLWVNF
jgi:hypothetical protein